MKTISKLFMAVVAGMLAFSCVTDTTEDLGVNLGEGQSTTLTLSLEESRTHLGIKDEDGNEYPLYWSEGDKIAVNGEASDALGVEYHGQQQATFKFTGTLLNYPYNIVYPAPAEGVQAVAEGCQVVTFAATQAYTADTFAEGSVPMYGYVADENAATTLNHLAGVLRIAPYGNATLKMLVITAENGKLAGNFDVDTEGNLTAHADATNAVTVTFGEGLTLGATEADAKPIYVAVPAGDYGSVSVTLITDKDSMTMGFNTSGENENGEPKAIKAGKVREFAAFEYEANSGTTGDFFIYDEASLLNFAENAATTASAKVVADIDMTGESWTAIDNYSGVFDGGNFKIKGLKAPLFGETTNAITIKNVHLTDVDITISNSLYAGAIALYISNAESTVENCSAEGKLSVTGELKDASTNPFFGGCFGRIEYATIISKITNKVDVTVAFSTVTDIIYVGGCVGLADYVRMEECHNDGDIQVTDASSYKNIYIGGVVSAIRSTVNHYKNLSNDGDITVNAKSSTVNTFVSGITAQHYSCILEGKHINTGDITVKGDNYALGIFISGVIGIPSKNTRILTITDAELSNSGTLTWSGTVTKSTVPNLHMGGIFTGTWGKFSGVAKSIVNTGDLICTGSIGAYAHIGGITTGRNTDAFNTNSAYDNLENAKCYCKIQAIDKGETCYIGMLSSVAYSSATAFKNSSVGGSVQTSADDEGKLTLDNYLQYLYRPGLTISESVIANIDKIGWLEKDINSTPQYKEIAGIEIGSADELLQFAEDVKANPTLVDVVAITADIDMTEVEWTPIEGFAGSFNGRNHEIKGLTAPLFGETQAVEIKNVKLTDVNISTSTLYTDALGAIACYASNTDAVIKDCSAAGSLTFTNSDTVIASKQIYIAGLIGCATTTNEISGLTNSVNVTMDNDGAGWIAGCIGKSYADTLKNCQNLGTIEYKSGNSQTTEAVYIMGVCSYSLGHVSNCTNGRLGEDGKPTEEGKVIYNGTITDNAYLSVSGICCVTTRNSTYFDIENCTNYAPIVLGGKRDAGGAKWSAVSGITSAPTHTSYSPEIRNCKNYGEIIIETNSPTTSPLYAAGIVAGYSRGKLTSLENYGQITVTDTAKSSGTQVCVAGIQATGFVKSGDFPNTYTDVKNAGDIVVKATVENMPNLEVSGVANSNAHLNSLITNCRCLCNIEAVGFTNVGMITGSARNAADPRVKNCAVGGSIATSTTAQGEIERPKRTKLSATNYYNYIYGGKGTDWTGVADYDGCTFDPTEVALPEEREE